jgi:hypothetical protein
MKMQSNEYGSLAGMLPMNHDTIAYATLDGVLATNHNTNASLPGGRFVEVRLEHKFYWIPEDVQNRPVESVDPRILSIGDNQTLPPVEVLEHLAQECDGVFEIDDDRHLRRIPTWARLVHEDGHIDSVHSDTLQAEIEDVRFPLSVSRDGRAAMFAYLAAHGFTNTMIADAFDVKSSTVRVNLSKYKPD